MINFMKVSGLGQCSWDSLFVVDSFPFRDTKKEVTEWTTSGGGPAATALVSLARLGMDCSFYGVTGDDEAGEKIAASLLLEGVGIQGIVARPGSLSQVAFICVDKQRGERTIFWKRPSAEAIKPEEIPDDFLHKTDFLLLDGLMGEASLYAARKAREHNIPLMLDAGSLREDTIELADLCDYVVASEEFAREILSNKSTVRGRDSSFRPEKALQCMRFSHAKAVTITLGSKGSITACGSSVFHTPAFRVDVVDTTGAGDVFHGGYIYGLLQKWDMQDVLRFASAFAALKCRALGGRAGIPSLFAVEQLLKQGKME